MFVTLICSVLNLSFIISSLLVVGLAVVGVIGFGDVKFAQPHLSLFRKNWYVLVVFLLLFLVVALSSNLITGYFGSTNDDAALHTLITRVILDHPSALWTRSSVPFGDFVLDYPSGAHVLSGFFIVLFGVSIQKIIMMVSAFMPALIALAFYSSVKCLFKSRLLAVLALFLAGFFGVVSAWFPVSWGGLPLLLSLYLSVSILGLFFVFIFRDRISWFSAFLVGLCFFIASETYPDALFVGIVWFFALVFLKRAIKIKRNSLN